MKSLKRIISIILVLAVAAVGAFFAAGCDFGKTPPSPPSSPVEPEKPEPTPKPEPEPTPKPEPEPEPTPNPKPALTTAELFKHIYEATAGDFTAKLTLTQTVGGARTERKADIVYGGEEEASIADEKSERISAGGLLFSRTGEVKIKDDDGEKTVPAYSAKSGTLSRLTEILKTAGEIAEPLAAQLGESVTIDEGAKDIKVGGKLSLAKPLGKLFALIKQNRNKPISSFVAECAKELIGEELSDEEAAAAIVGFGGTTIEKLSEKYGKLFDAEFYVAFSVLRSALGETMELPEIDEFKEKYGGMTLSEFLGAGTEAELLGIATSRPLSEILEKIPFMQSTLCALFSSSAETTFDKVDMTLSLTCDKTYKLTAAKLAIDLSINKFPTFLPSLDESGVREEDVDIKNSYSAEAVFSAVGTSEIKSPEYFAYEGEQTVEIVCGGEYAYHAGKLNTFDKDAEIMLEVESGAIDDPAHWADIMGKIRDGTQVDRNAKKIRISDTAYKCLIEAKKLGLTRIAVPAYKEFSFVFDIR